MIESISKIRVRYAETDQMGVVHHSTYPVYFEIGRTELIKNLGKSYKKIEEEGIILPVISFDCKFFGPAAYDDELIIKTTLKGINGVKLTFSYEITNEGKIICTGNTILAFASAITRKPARPPGWFVEMCLSS